MSHVEINHDAFARQSLVREKLPSPCKCAWCGNGLAKFRYGIEPDGRPGRVNWAKGEFCGVACYRSYHT